MSALERNSTYTPGSAMALAVARIITGVFFLFFGAYKIVPSVHGFSNGVVQGYLEEFVQKGYAVRFYRSFLIAVVLPHANAFTLLVGVLELALGVALLVGLVVRLASVAGALHMISLTLATWHEAGQGAAPWQWFGVQLDHIPLLLLFALFYFGDAGQIWGLDAMCQRGQSARSRKQRL